MKNRLPAGVRARLFFYNLLSPAALLAMLPGLARRMARRGNYRRKFGQRFGIYDAQTRERLRSGEWTWVHSISVGETVLALKIARKMKELDPGLRVVLSATTSTGFALAEQSAEDWIEVLYNPLDAAWIVRRALALVRPRRLIFIEAIWPNLLACAKKRGIPAALIARLSPRSAARFRRFRFFTDPIFRLLDAICVQEPDDTALWQALGADAAKIHVTGNAKFDHSPAPPKRLGEFRELLRGLGVREDAPILLAGSTFPGEERILAEVFRKLRAEFPQLFLIIVPRHVERTGEAAADVTESGLTFALRTAADVGAGAAAGAAAAASASAASGGRGPGPDTAPDCLIVNTTGELREWYHAATVVFIGKSLTSTGGQNPVEAVAAGKPVIFGPHMENFRAIVEQWLAADAAIQVADAAALEAQTARLLRDPDLRAALAGRARRIAAAHEGATARIAQLLSRLR